MPTPPATPAPAAPSRLRSFRSFGFLASFLPALTGLVLVGLAASCVEQDDEKPTDDDMKVAKQNILTTAPTPRFPVNADLDGKIVYIGLDTEAQTIEPGKDFKLTHYWKLVAPPGDGWKTFTHLDGPNHQNFINADHAPVKGKYAVSAWKPGEISGTSTPSASPGTGRSPR